jgi:hypothetical protein
MIVVRHTKSAKIAMFLRVLIGSAFPHGVADQPSGFGQEVVGRRFTNLTLVPDDASRQE